MQDVEASIQLMMDAMEAWLSDHLLGNWKEELDEFLKEVVQSRGLGNERQHKLQNEIEHLKREIQIGEL